MTCIINLNMKKIIDYNWGVLIKFYVSNAGVFFVLNLAFKNHYFYSSIFSSTIYLYCNVIQKHMIHCIAWL